MLWLQPWTKTTNQVATSSCTAGCSPPPKQMLGCPKPLPQLSRYQREAAQVLAHTNSTLTSTNREATATQESTRNVRLRWIWPRRQDTVSFATAQSAKQGLGVWNTGSRVEDDAYGPAVIEIVLPA
jgi:hypothetical protein